MERRERRPGIRAGAFDCHPRRREARATAVNHSPTRGYNLDSRDEPRIPEATTTTCPFVGLDCTASV